MGNMSEAMLSDLEPAPELYANRIREKVLSLLQEHEAKTFHLWMEQDHIVCEPNYRFKDMITTVKGISSVPKSLYEAWFSHPERKRRKRSASVDGRPRMYAGFIYVIHRPVKSCVLASSGSYPKGCRWVWLTSQP